MEENLCCVYGTINAMLFILSFWTVIRHSVLTSTLNSCNTWMKICKENIPHLWMREKLCFYDNERPHSVRIPREKILNLSSSFLLHLTYLPDLIPNDFGLFHSQQNVLNVKLFSKDQMKLLVENVFKSKPAFTWKKPISFSINGKWWFKIMVTIILI